MSDTKQEIAFANELAKYAGRWVGVERVGRKETILVSGDRITDAMAEARKKRVMRRVVFMKVPHANRIWIPTIWVR